MDRIILVIFFNVKEIVVFLRKKFFLEKVLEKEYKKYQKRI